MTIKSGDFVNISLTLLSVDGEKIPSDSGDQTIQRSLEVGSLQKEALDNFISSEALLLGEEKQKKYHLAGDLFFPNYREDLICKISRKNVDKDIEEGELIQNKNGNVGYVTDTKSHDFVLVDFNHPFSNKILEVDLKILQLFKRDSFVSGKPCSSLS